MKLCRWAALTLCLVCLTTAARALTPEEDALLCAYRDGTLVRLHILADNDGAEAQRVKLHVRDRLLQAFSDALTEAAVASDGVYEYLCAHRADMLSVATDAAREAGFAGDVQAEAGVLLLPAKRYGDVVLPQGRYRALRVTLGSGAGRNWWCVLYPSLCLAVAQEPSEGGAGAPQLVFDSLRVLRNWLCHPIP